MAGREGTVVCGLYVIAAHSALLRAGGMSLGVMSVMQPLARDPLTPTRLRAPTINLGEAGEKPGGRGACYVTGICKEVYIRC